MILKHQQAVCNKAGLGYRSYQNKKSAYKLYKKSSQENLTCFIYQKLGHKSYTYNSKNISKSNRVRNIWIKKNTSLTHHEGPKKTWVPKSTYFMFASMSCSQQK